jgi:ribonucleoside-diphosphate reductase alpha chain
MNQRIFEHLYYSAVEESANLAQEFGSYETFQGSPASKGKLQPDLWGVVPLTENDETLDWRALRLKAQSGLRNSLLVAPMPTASTSQILGYNECFEPFTSNLYTRRTLAGEFIIINKYLMKDLMKLDIWSEQLKQEIVARNGSIQGISVIPEQLQLIYKTSWELKQRTLIDMAAARGAFICQSQSLNLFVADPTYSKLTSMHFHAWKSGLKTGCYYLRTKAPVTAQKFTIDPRLLSAVQNGGNTNTVHEDDKDSYESDSESDSDNEKAVLVETKTLVVETRAEQRAALLEKLAKDYEDTEKEGCLMCSS